MKISWKTIKDMLCNNVVLKVLSVIIAIAMWLLVINIEDPQVTTTIKNIPVHILNENAITGNEEAYDVLSGDTVTIKVTGPRTIVDSLNKDDFTATADFKDLSKTNAVPINISINNTRYESKITISEKSDNAMRLSVVALVEKDYEVGVQTSGKVQDGYVLYNTVPEENTVVIKAPEAVHEQIRKVSLLLNLSGEETENFSYICGAVAYDYSNRMLDTKVNHMTISKANIVVDGVVYYKKTVDIDYNVANNMGDGIIMTEYEASAEKADIIGLKEKLDEINKIVIPEEMTVLTSEKQKIEIDLNKLLPEGVMVYGENNIFTITAKTESIVTKSISIRTGDIGIKNIPDGYEASINNSGNLSITLSGRQSDIDALDDEKLAPYVDLSSALMGENSVKVNVILPEDVSQTQSAYVTVVLTEKSSREPETDNTTASTTTTVPETSTSPTEERTEEKTTPTETTTEETTVPEEENTTPLQ